MYVNPAKLSKYWFYPNQLKGWDAMRTASARNICVLTVRINIAN